MCRYSQHTYILMSNLQSKSNYSYRCGRGQYVCGDRIFFEVSIYTASSLHHGLYLRESRQGLLNNTGPSKEDFATGCTISHFPKNVPSFLTPCLTLLPRSLLPNFFNHGDFNLQALLVLKPVFYLQTNVSFGL